MRRQQGVALISVLLVVAIVTVVCAGLIARQQLAIRASANQFLARQAWHYALGGEALARAVLKRDLLAPGSVPGKSVDHLYEEWAKPLPAFPVDQGELRVRIEDLAARFNVNALVQGGQRNDAAIAQFRRLLLQLEIDKPYPELLADWLDKDQEPGGESGAEDSQYLLLEPPYRTADRRLQDVSELRLLLGMSETEYRRLAPYVCALPSKTPINVNTAGPMVLSSLADGLTPELARQLVLARGDQGFADISNFFSQPVLAGRGELGSNLDVGSQFFLVVSEVRIADRRLVLSSTVQRDKKGRVYVLQRNLGLPAGMPATPRNDEG